MKHLNKFLKYIKESNDLSTELLEDSLIPIKDLGFTVNIKESVLFTEDKKSKKYLEIYISLNGLKRDKLISNKFNVKTTYINDNKFWELLEEILTLKYRMLDNGMDDCYVDFNKRGYSRYISLLLLKEDNLEVSNIIELVYRLNYTLNSMKSDFAYDTFCNKVEYGKLNVISNIASYTDRKFDNLLRKALEDTDLSKSDFNFEKKIDGDSVIIYISEK